MKELSGANSGIIFRQLTRGDARQTEEHLKKLMRKAPGRKRRTIVTVADRGVAAPLPADLQEHMARRVTVVEARAHGTKVNARLDTGALSNIMAGNHVQRLLLMPTATNRQINMADNGRR